MFGQYDFFFFIGKLHSHPVEHEPMTSLSALLQREEVPLELKLIRSTKKKKKIPLELERVEVCVIEGKGGSGRHRGRGSCLQAGCRGDGGN